MSSNPIALELLQELPADKQDGTRIFLANILKDQNKIKVCAKLIPHNIISKEEVVNEFYLSTCIDTFAILPVIGLATRIIDDIPYYILLTPYCKNRDLFDLVYESQLIMPPLVASYSLFPIVHALATLHANNIIHRDIKPENIFIGDVQNDNGFFLCETFLSDFGYARKLNSGSLIADDFRGTKTTIAPEVLRYHPYGLKADVWSLGVTLYFSLVGNYPYHIDSIGFDIGNDDHFLQYQDQISMFDDVTQSLLIGMLNPDPQARFSMLDVLNHPFFDSVRGCFEDDMRKRKVLSAHPSVLSEITNDVLILDDALLLDDLFIFDDVYT